MRRFLLRLLLAATILGALVSGPARAGIALYSDRGRTDFDTAIQFLNAYGTWSKVDGLWAFTPLDHQVPYTHGRWIYTDYGWTWIGAQPGSWVTEHYGYWKRGADHVWSWFPGPLWLPQIVELRVTPVAIGWRSAAVDGEGNFVEESSDRYAKVDEWTFVSRAAFAQPITPAVVASPAEAAKMLDESTDSFHSYLTYRPIARPGPHPADFLALAGGEGMFPPRIYTAPVEPARPLLRKASTAPAPAKSPAAPAADDNGGPPPDPRQVHYWTSMSLPGAWTPPPADAKPEEVYLYRPDFYQDQDGIERRIGLWLDPASRTSMKLNLQSVLSDSNRKPSPATPASGPGAFRSEYQNDYPGGAAPAPAPAPAPKAPATNQVAPTGRASAP